MKTKISVITLQQATEKLGLDSINLNDFVTPNDFRSLRKSESNDFEAPIVKVADKELQPNVIVDVPKNNEPENMTEKI